MPLQLRVLATGQVLEVPNEGQTIGRQGGPADVQLNDPGLSGKHLRVFADGSEWLIQDLGSSNGTLIGGIKIDATTQIHLDDIITIGTTKLEVAKIWDAEVQRTMMVAAPIFDTVPTGTPAVQRRTKEPAASAAAPAPAATTEMPSQDDSMAPTMLGGVGAMSPEEAEKIAAAAAPKKPPPSAPRGQKGRRVAAVATDPGLPAEAAEKEAASDDAPAEEPAADMPAGGDKFDIKYFLVAVPKAIAFYLAAIPLLIVNPIGYVRKGIAEQKHPAMGKMQLIAYALPALFVSSFLPSIAAGIALAVRGTFSIMSFIPIGPAIGAVIGAVVSGFLFHPVMKWIIEKLKGQSDEKSRTNYFLMLMTATAVLAVPTAVSTLLTLVPLPFIGFIGVLVQIVASAASVFILYSWLVHFDVMKVVRTVVLVLGALGALGSLYGGVMAQVALLRGGGTGVAGASGDAEKALADAEKLRAKMEADAKEATEKAGEVAEAADEAKEAAKEAKGTAKEAAKETKETKVAAAEKPPAEEKAEAAPKGETTLAYPAFKAMRDGVEKTLADKPELLTGDADLLAMYRKYSAAATEVENKYKALDAKNPADAKLNARLRDAELHQKTEASIVALNAKLKGGGAAAAPAKEEKAAPAKEEKKAEAKPAPAKEEKPKAEAKPAPAKEEKPKAEAKPAPAKEEKKAEAKPAPAAKEEKPKEAAKPAGKGKLACTSKPAGAEVWVDGKNTGKKTPLAPGSALELPAGKHSVVFKLNGKASAAQEINVEANGQVTLKGVEIPGA